MPVVVFGGACLETVWGRKCYQNLDFAKLAANGLGAGGVAFKVGRVLAFENGVLAQHKRPVFERNRCQSERRFFGTISVRKLVPHRVKTGICWFEDASKRGGEWEHFGTNEETKTTPKLNTTANITYIHTYIHTYMHACMHACMHTYIHTYIHTYHPPKHLKCFAVKIKCF